MYVLPSALDELAAFGGATFTALGYSSDPADGLSFRDFVLFQRDFVNFAETLGEAERKSCLDLANLEFRRALAYAGELYIAQVFSAAPVDAALDHFLPSGSAYEH
eukprot:364289-Pleurochrysis_carterae.AAC.1